MGKAVYNGYSRIMVVRMKWYVERIQIIVHKNKVLGGWLNALAAEAFSLGADQTHFFFPDGYSSFFFFFNYKKAKDK